MTPINIYLKAIKKYDNYDIPIALPTRNSNPFLIPTNKNKNCMLFIINNKIINYMVIVDNDF